MIKFVAMSPRFTKLMQDLQKFTKICNVKDLGTRLTNLFMNNSDFKGKPAFFVVPMNFVLSESGISGIYGVILSGVATRYVSDRQHLHIW